MKSFNIENIGLYWTIRKAFISINIINKNKSLNEEL